MQYRAMRYVSFKKELCCRKKKYRRIGSGEVRAKEKELADREIKEARSPDDRWYWDDFGDAVEAEDWFWAHTDVERSLKATPSGDGGLFSS